MLIVIWLTAPLLSASADALFGWEDDLFHLYDVGLTFAIPEGAMLADYSEVIENRGLVGLEPTTILLLYMPEPSIICVVGATELQDPGEIGPYAITLAQIFADTLEISLDDVDFLETDFFGIGAIRINFAVNTIGYSIDVMFAPFGAYAFALIAPEASAADVDAFLDELLAPMR